jgi:hypothetical protein
MMSVAPWLPDELLVAIFERCTPAARLRCVPHVCKRWRRVNASSMRAIDLTDPCFSSYGVCTITSAAYRRLVQLHPLATVVRVHRAAFLNASDLCFAATATTTELSLSGCIAVDDGVIGHIAACCPKLRVINIDCAINVTTAALRVLCSCCALLTSISIGGCGRIDADALSALTGCPSLTHLCLTGTALAYGATLPFWVNRLGHIELFAAGVHFFPALTHLTLNGGCVWKLGNTLPALTHLRAPNTPRHPFDTNAAMRVAAQFPAIVDVDVRSDFAVPVATLMYLLQHCDGLRHLTAHSALPLPTSLTTFRVVSSRLTHLTCSGLTDESLTHLVNVCPCLTHVDIAGSNVRTAKVLAVPQLKFLCLDNTCVGDGTILALAQRATSLETVCWRSTLEVYPSGLAFAVLLTLPALRHLRFSIHRNTKRLQWAIARARKRNVCVERHWLPHF